MPSFALPAVAPEPETQVLPEIAVPPNSLSFLEMKQMLIHPLPFENVFMGFNPGEEARKAMEFEGNMVKFAPGVMPLPTIMAPEASEPDKNVVSLTLPELALPGIILPEMPTLKLSALTPDSSKALGFDFATLKSLAPILGVVLLLSHLKGSHA